MSHPKFKQSYRALADRWGTTSTTVRRYSERGCNWDNDFETALWLIKYTRKRTPAMRKAIYAVPGISDPIARDQSEPQQKTADKHSEIDCHAWGKLMTLYCDIEAGIEELKPGDIEDALRLQKEVVRFNSMVIKLTAGSGQR